MNITAQPRWSLGHGNPPVPSGWQATIKCRTHAWTIAAGQRVLMASGSPFESVAHDDAHVGHAAVLDLTEHRKPILRALALKSRVMARDTPRPS